MITQFKSFINECCVNETCKDKVIKELNKMEDSKQYNQLTIDECVKNITLNKIITTNIQNSNEKSEEIKCKKFAKDIQSIKEICKKSKNMHHSCLDKIKSVYKEMSSAQKELKSIKSISIKFSNIAPSDSPPTPKFLYSSLIPQFEACHLSNSKLFDSITSLFDLISKNHSNTSEKISSLSSLVNEYSESLYNITNTVSFDDKDQLDLSSSLQFN